MKLQFASQLLSNCPFNDATLEFSDGSLSISRMILASHCKQFYDLFSENPNKDHFKCKNLKLCDFKIYYEYLHLDAEFIIDGAKLVSLMKVHAALNISDLMEKLNKWMVTENFASYLNYFFDQNTNNEVHKEQIGGKNAIDSVVEINIKKSSVKRISQLSIGKAHHCSERIGDYVFVLGDANNSQIEKYDLKNNVSEVAAFTMTSKKDDYSSVLYENQIYVIGGRSDYQSIDIVEYFDLEQMKWYNTSTLLQSFRDHDSVIVDRTIYVVGDYESKKFQRFDRREGKWSFLVDIPENAYYTSMSSWEQKITCIGGGIKARLMGQVYDIRNDKWEQIENLPIFIYGAKSLESESHIIVAGGYGTDKIHSYDKSKKIWSNLNIKLPKENWNVSKVLI